MACQLDCSELEVWNHNAQSSIFHDSRLLCVTQNRNIMVAAMEERTSTTMAIVRPMRGELLWKFGITPSGGGPHGMVHGSTPGGMLAIAKMLMFEGELD